jgi:HK97 gp10 family phage protein
MARTRAVVKTTGFKELEAALRELPERVGRNAARKAVARAGQEMADDMREFAPVDDGDLRDSIVSTVKTRNLDGLAEYAASKQSGGSTKEAVAALRSARRDAKASGSQKGHRIEARAGPSAPHAHLVEFGTAPRHWKSNGKFTGSMPPQPYMRPAWDYGKDKALRTIKDGLTQDVKEAAQRVAKRRGRAK